jgi:homoserine kinase
VRNTERGREKRVATANLCNVAAKVLGGSVHGRECSLACTSGGNVVRKGAEWPSTDEFVVGRPPPPLSRGRSRTTLPSPVHEEWSALLSSRSSTLFVASFEKVVKASSPWVN